MKGQEVRKLFDVTIEFHFFFFFDCKDGDELAARFFVNALVLLSNSSSLSSATFVSFSHGADSSAFLPAFLFPASNFARNFLSTGSFEGVTWGWRGTAAPIPSLQTFQILI